ncbi:MAG: radical SAM protein [Candidatus Omnitrophota bacterium]
MSNRLHGAIIVTYRCNARCNMCNVWQHPSRPSEEIGPDVMDKLPRMFFCNITGGEPFVRQDLAEIVSALRRKARRIVVSTNGFFTERIIALCRRFPDLGIRISIEGLEQANDKIRGLPGGYKRTIETLQRLGKMGLRDIGFAMTAQDINCVDLVSLYEKAKGLGYEFATATLHNSHYFHKWDNRIKDKQRVCAEISRLVRSLLSSPRPKDWARAYFNHGLINYIHGRPRPLPCPMGQDGFFLDPAGDVLACNGMDEKQPMGNLRRRPWKEIWRGPEAERVRRSVKSCPKNCWMVGSAAPAIWRHPLRPIAWVAARKFTIYTLPFRRRLKGKVYCG